MVDSCGDIKKVHQPQITINNFNESVNELNKMDIFVCGTCYFVSHFVEEFIGHKEEPCERTENIQPNTSDQKPQVWSFLLWKNAKHRANTQNSSWQLYQEWCTLPESVKDTWIQAGQFLKASSTIRTANRRTFGESHVFLDEEELSQMKAMVANRPVPNSNKVMKRTRSGKCLDMVVERILAKRIVNKKTEYWVKYKGRPSMEEKYWEPVEAMQPTCQDMIATFENKYLSTDPSRKRTLSQSLESAGLLNNIVGNKQKMEHVKQWVQDDTSGRIHGEDGELAKKRMRTDEETHEDYEEFFSRQYGGIIRRVDMKSCPASERTEALNKKKNNLAAELGLESEEEEEDGGKENIFGRKNVPAVLKPNEHKPPPPPSPPSPIPITTRTSLRVRSKQNLNPVTLPDLKTAKGRGKLVPFKRTRKKQPIKKSPKLKSSVVNADDVILDPLPFQQESVYDQVEITLANMLEETPVKTNGRNRKTRATQNDVVNGTDELEAKRSKQKGRKKVGVKTTGDLTLNCATATTRVERHDVINKVASGSVKLKEDNIGKSKTKAKKGKRVKNGNHKIKTLTKQNTTVQYNNSMTKEDELFQYEAEENAKETCKKTTRQRKTKKTIDIKESVDVVDKIDEDIIIEPCAQGKAGNSHETYSINGNVAINVTDCLKEKPNVPETSTRSKSLPTKKSSLPEKPVLSFKEFLQRTKQNSWQTTEELLKNNGPPRSSRSQEFLSKTWFSTGQQSLSATVSDNSCGFKKVWFTDENSNSPENNTKLRLLPVVCVDCVSTQSDLINEKSSKITQELAKPSPKKRVRKKANTKVKLTQALLQESIEQVSLSRTQESAESSSTNDIEPKVRSDIVEPKAQSDIVEPMVRSDTVEPKVRSDIVEPKDENDIVEPKAESDIVEPKAESDIVEPNTKSDIEPKAQSDIVEPKVPFDIIEPKAQSDIVKPRARSDIVEPKSRSTIIEISGHEEKIETCNNKGLNLSDLSCSQSNVLFENEKLISTSNIESTKVAPDTKSIEVEPVSSTITISKPKRSSAKESKGSTKTPKPRAPRPPRKKNTEKKPSSRSKKAASKSNEVVEESWVVEKDLGENFLSELIDSTLADFNDQLKSHHSPSVNGTCQIENMNAFESNTTGDILKTLDHRNVMEQEEMPNSSVLGITSSVNLGILTSLNLANDVDQSEYFRFEENNSSNCSTFSKDNGTTTISQPLKILNSKDQSSCFHEVQDDANVSNGLTVGESNLNTFLSTVDLGTGLVPVIKTNILTVPVSNESGPFPQYNNSEKCTLTELAPYKSEQTPSHGCTLTELASYKSDKTPGCTLTELAPYKSEQTPIHGESQLSRRQNISEENSESPIESNSKLNDVQSQGNRNHGEGQNLLTNEYVNAFCLDFLSDHSNLDSLTPNETYMTSSSVENGAAFLDNSGQYNGVLCTPNSYTSFTTSSNSQGPYYSRIPYYDPRNSGLKLPTARHRFPVINRPEKIKLVKKKSMSSQDSSPAASLIPPSPCSMPPPSQIPPASPCRYPCPPPFYLNYHPYPYRKHEKNLLNPWGSDYPGESVIQGGPVKKPLQKRKPKKKIALPVSRSYLSRFLADPNAAVIPPSWSPPPDECQQHVENSLDVDNESSDCCNVSIQPAVCFEVNTSGELVRKDNTSEQICNSVDSMMEWTPLSAATDMGSQCNNMNTPEQSCNSVDNVIEGTPLSSDTDMEPQCNNISSEETQPPIWTGSQSEICSLMNDPNVLIQWNGTAGLNNQWDSTSSQTLSEEVSSTVSFSFLTPDCDEISVSYPKLCLQTDSSDTSYPWSSELSEDAEQTAFYVEEVQIQQSTNLQQSAMISSIIDDFFTDSQDSYQNVQEKDLESNLVTKQFDSLPQGEGIESKDTTILPDPSDSAPIQVDYIETQFSDLKPDMPSLEFSP